MAASEPRTRPDSPNRQRIAKHCRLMRTSPKDDLINTPVSRDAEALRSERVRRERGTRSAPKTHGAANQNSLQARIDHGEGVLALDVAHLRDAQHRA